MGEFRLLTQADAADVYGLLTQRPIDNIFLLSRFLKSGIESFGNPLIGWYEAGVLSSVLSQGYTLFPVNSDETALRVFARQMGNRKASSIIGRRDECMGLWAYLCEESHAQWAHPRDVRDHQRVMVIDSEARVTTDPRVMRVPTRHIDPYFTAARAMYTEEVGVAPLDVGAYRSHVATLMMKGMSFGIVEDERIIFKADVTADADGIAQIGGVWIAPEHRGIGMSAPCVAAVVSQLRQSYRAVTLYVNAHNSAAIACYERVGFHAVSECATVLY